MPPRGIILIDRLMIFLFSIGLLWITDGLTTIPVSMEVIKEAKITEEGILSKRLSMILAKRVATTVLCLLRILKPLIKRLTKLSVVLEKVKMWAGAKMLITRILIVGKKISVIKILMARFKTKKLSARLWIVS